MAKFMNSISVRNCSSPSTGNEVANQFIIRQRTDKGVREIFQSYRSVIAVIDEEGNVTLDRHKWDYSVTTGRYRNQFLGEDIRETRKKIEQGIYTLADLN